MKKIKNLSHNKFAFSLAGSRLIERISFYGVRSLLVLYMLSEGIQMEADKAIVLYSWFAGSIMLTQIIGALFGDLLVGNRKAIIFGGLIQAGGVFCLIVPSVYFLYIGLFLIAIGGGLFTPNLIANFGKYYLARKKLLDSGYAFLHFAMNIGGLIGPLLIGAIGYNYGWSFGFGVSGILLLVAIAPPLLIPEPQLGSNTFPNKVEIRVVKIFMAILIAGLFWAVYEIASTGIFELQERVMDQVNFQLPDNPWSTLSIFLIIPFGIVAVVFWSFYYSKQFTKLTIGLLFGALSFGLLFLININPAWPQSLIFLISIVLISVAEIFIAPVVYSVVTEFTSPKYLAIIISLTFIPPKAFTAIVGILDFSTAEGSSVFLGIGVVVTTLVTIGMAIFLFIYRKFIVTETIQGS
ncbi:MFS transporter [Flagellimonas myxillae]|uniref:MFS transporter n=1 Tax=Flagellimonas myxillae TaxID=2942214 RepID=UPI00201F3191|nr:MFS transporter [Muricauda myxillae]MCL6268200.1 MFS transporter [Muricauda myxillae]